MRLFFRLLGLLIILSLGVAAWVLLMPDPRGSDSHGSLSATAAPVPVADDASAPHRHVRVVYPDATTDPNGVVSPKVEARIDVADTPATSMRTTPPATAADVPRISTELPSPTKVEPVAPPTGQALPSATPSLSSVNLNTASVDMLNRIPGGGSIGRTIVAHRPYKSVDDLLSKRVVRRSVFDRIRQQVAAD